VFWTWPVAPPRMLQNPQFLDLAALVRGESPHWPPGAVSLDANQLSAFPSLHIAWAVWSTIVLFRLSHRRLVRGLAVLHPLVTGFAVMATANHYLADAVAGGALALVAVALADRIWSRRPDRGRLTPSGVRCSHPR
jgi:diacylglycerol O-acyltransferase